MCDDQGHDRGPDEGRRPPEGPDTGFVQFEVSEMVRAAGRRAFDEAVHKVLTEYVSDELKKRCGDELKELAAITVEQQMDQIQRNAAIEKLVQENKEQEDGMRKKARSLVERIADKAATGK